MVPSLYGLDFKETRNPLVKATTIRIILNIVVHRDWTLRQVQINNAFLNGDLIKTLNMLQPKGFKDKKNPNHICKLRKALNDLR